MTGKYSVHTMCRKQLLIKSTKSPSLCCTGDQRPSAATACQRLPVPDHWHGQAAGRHPGPNGLDVRRGEGAPADAHPQRRATHTPRPHS
eukprot:271754-Chlamydomonas_euryale.AAC.4